jgi:drug/metabolite transporter (DMT)-like permease
VITPFAFWGWQPPDFNSWVLLIALGGTFGVAQLTQIAGLARAPASLVAPLAYVQIIAAVIFGLVIFHEVPDVLSLIGIVMIIGAGLYVVQRRRQT